MRWREAVQCLSLDGEVECKVLCSTLADHTRKNSNPTLFWFQVPEPVVELLPALAEFIQQ